MNFRDSLPADKAVFFCPDEFAEEHDLNGTVCPCIVQSPTARETFLQGVSYDGYDGISGKTVIVHVATDKLPEIPREGQVFTLDEETMTVNSCVNDIGILSITLHQHVGTMEGVL
nr:MAG TPA_asm: Gifsy-2 prophage ATP-binding sugar transporter-like barrel, 4 helix bundle.7A [Caudoviricetes sp.]